MSAAQDYPLGYSEREAERLADQAAQVEAFTEDLLRRAGLRPGMHVLDVGSGVGDVAQIAGRVVGPNGAVLGVDKAASSVEIARRRAADLGLQNVAFESGDLADFATDRRFDAIVGRFVLLYVPEPAAALQRLAARLKPGGIVAFQELDLSTISQAPASELFTQTRQWILDAFAAGGAELNMGTGLYQTFRRAGLPGPNMMSVTPVVCGPASGGYAEMAKVLASLLPVIERHGIADPEEIGVDTLAERLREDAVAHDRVIFMSRIVGAWTRLA